MAYNYLKLTDFTPDKFTVYIKLQLNSVPGLTLDSMALILNQHLNQLLHKHLNHLSPPPQKKKCFFVCQHFN